MVQSACFISQLSLIANSILSQQMSLFEAQKLTLRVLKQVMEEKLDHHNVQLAQVSNSAYLLDAIDRLSISASGYT